MQAMPGALGPLTIPPSAVAGRMAIHGMPPTALHSVLLVSNLNPDVSDSAPSLTLVFLLNPAPLSLSLFLPPSPSPPPSLSLSLAH